MNQNIELLSSWGQSIAKNITAQVIGELQQTPFTESVEDYEQGITNLWKKVCSDDSNQSDIYGLLYYVTEQAISKQVKQLPPLEKIALYEAIARDDKNRVLDQSELQALKYSDQSILDEDNAMIIMHCMDFIVDQVRIKVPKVWTTFKSNPDELKNEIEFSRILNNRENGVFVSTAKARRTAKTFDQTNGSGVRYEHLVMRKLGQIALDNLSLKVIEELKTFPITQGTEFSSDEVDIKTFWDELCLQSQGTQNFSWESFLEELESIAYRMLKKLPLEEQFVMWMVIEDLDDLLRDLDEVHVGSFDEIENLKVDNVAVAEHVRRKVYQAACIEKHPIVSRILG